jgi:hypothetical protein
MGDPYRKQQVKNAQKRREESYRLASEPRLPASAMLKDTKLTLIPDDGIEYVCGEKLAILADETSVKVVRDGYQHVGHIEGEIATQLREVFAAAGGTNVLEVLVTNVAGISGVAHAQIVQQ